MTLRRRYLSRVVLLKIEIIVYRGMNLNTLYGSSMTISRQIIGVKGIVIINMLIHFVKHC